MFFHFGIKDAIDIFLVAVLLYYIYRFMRESRTMNVFGGVLAVIIVWLFVAKVLEMRLMGALLDQFFSVGVLAIIILFQEEIRKFLFRIGEQERLHSLMNWFVKKEEDADTVDRTTILPIVMACINMSKAKCGALIVIERLTPLDDIVEQEFVNSLIC